MKLRKLVPIPLYRLEGRMESAYPGYCGSFRAVVQAKSVATAKRRFERKVHKEYPASGIEAPLVAPIIRYTTAAVMHEECLWGIVSHDSSKS